MDQLASACGLADHALCIDCRSLEVTSVMLPESASVLVLDTGTRRGLLSSAYNQRREECRAGAQAFGLASLRDLGGCSLPARSPSTRLSVGVCGMSWGKMPAR
jgi:galactokinase